MRGSRVTPELDRCYRALELDAGASADAVKDAWRDLTKVWHPDRFTHDVKLQARAQARMQELNKARKVLEHHLSGGSAWEFQAKPVSWITRVRENWIRPGPLFAFGLFSGVALLSVWAARSTYRDRGLVDSSLSASLPHERTDHPSSPGPAERSMVLVARGPVRVMVTSVADARVLLPETNLETGGTIPVPRPGDVFIKYSAGENLQVEIDGERYDMPSTGADRAKLR
jgi:hypothetical protein